MDARKIKTISVEKLFGMYDYSLTVPSPTIDNVFIIYGDNGTGKSTVLRLAFHLLTSEMGNYHRTYIASGAITVDFRRILSLTRCGNKRESFIKNTIVPLITPDTNVYQELERCIFG